MKGRGLLFGGGGGGWRNWVSFFVVFCFGTSVACRPMTFLFFFFFFFLKNKSPSPVFSFSSGFFGFPPPPPFFSLVIHRGDIHWFVCG